jgi:tetratricopeptide (TPR) repeat protein
MKPRIWPLLLALLTAPCSAQSPDDLGKLIVAGELDRAETLARAGGDSLRVVLADILVLRGRLTEAESLYTQLSAAPGPNARRATAALAELAARRGDRGQVHLLARPLADEWRNRSGQWSAHDHLAAGRAFRLLDETDPAAVRDALAAFDAATAADPELVEGALAAADLFLERYNAPDARSGYQAVLAARPSDPRALVGLARVAAFSNEGDPTPLVRQALDANPRSVPALLLLSRLYLESEQYDSASAKAQLALAADSSSIDAWAAIGALAWVAGDTPAYARAEAAATALNPRPATFLAAVAEAAGRHRRYAEAVQLAERAVAFDSVSGPALGALGTNLLRVGRMDEGKAVLERAFALDPYHLWHKNTLDLLDDLAEFRTVNTARFQIVAPARNAELLAITLGPLLEAAYDSLAARYQYRPPTPIRIELYDRHADFSVRTVGLAGLGALGVSFGPLLVMDAPEARPRGTFNVGSTAWHELAHTFTLGASNNRVPRWVSEGLSVLEERRTRGGWGARADISFVQALAGGTLLPVAELNDGFVRPDGPNRIGLSYYQASLVMEFLEEQHGIAGIRRLLRAYADGSNSDAALRAVSGVSTDTLELQFRGWVRTRFSTPLAAIAGGDPEVIGVQMATAAAALNAGDTANAIRILRAARERFPELGDGSGPGMPLAIALWHRGDRRGALAELAVVTGHDETAFDANMLEAEWRVEVGDTALALAALDRASWIAPNDLDTWRRRAELAEATGRNAETVLARRAIVALRPADPVAARTDLAAALLRSGDATAARRELLTVLEQAPGYERAQGLLLEARRQ